MSPFRKGSFSKTPLTRSQMAERQPRDNQGRFAKYKTMMIIDEFGNTGPSHPHERKFGYAVSVTDKPDRFGRITDENRNRYSKEIKARDDRDNQDKITREISKQGVKTYAYYVDKKNPPEGWDNKDRSKVMIGMLDYSINHTLPNTKGNVMVVVDNHNAYKGSVRPLVESKSRVGRNVYGDEYDSHTGMYSEQLQTHDYVTNAARGCVELGDPSRTKILGTKIVHVDKNRSIVQNKR